MRRRSRLFLSPVFWLLVVVQGCDNEPATPPLPPSHPVGLEVRVEAPSRIVLEWDPVEGATSYTTYWSHTHPATPETGTAIPNVASPFAHTDLIADTSYYYVVTAVGPGGESVPSTQVSIILPSVPSRPTGVAASSSTTPNAVKFSWAFVPHATSYAVYWSTSPNVTKESGTRVVVTERQFEHIGLTPGQTHYYAVAGVSDAGESPLSTIVHATPSGDVGVRIIAPMSGAPAGDSLEIRAAVTSRLQLASVRATIGIHQVDLSVSSGEWRASIPAEPLANGVQQLVVTATDIAGSRADASQVTVIDLEPHIIIESPISGTVSRGTIRVAARCIDDAPSGCVALSANATLNANPLPSDPRQRLADGTASIDMVVMLDAIFDGRQVRINFTGVDSARQAIHIVQFVFVETNARLHEIATVPGRVLDVQGDRVLYYDSTSNIATLRIRMISNGSDVVITQDSTQAFGLLTPNGAVFLDAQHQLREWQAGTVTTLGPADNVVVEGQYVLLAANAVVRRRDVIAGTTVTLWTRGIQEMDVASDGSTALGDWPTTRDIWWIRGAALDTLRLTNDDDAVVWNLDPRTDGVHVVYTKRPPCCPPTSTERIALHDGQTETVLSTRTEPYGNFSPRIHYDVRGGWTAFVREPADGTVQLWSRSPAGVLRQLSQLAARHLLEDLGSGGEVVFRSDTRRFFASSTIAAVDIGSRQGTALWRDGRFIVLLGNTVFEVRP
jgi:hypothetical protein